MKKYIAILIFLLPCQTKAQQVFETVCPAGQTSIQLLQTFDVFTGKWKQNYCVDSSGNVNINATNITGTISVASFGALGNGINDDGPAFNAAIAACPTNGCILTGNLGAVYGIKTQIVDNNSSANGILYYFPGHTRFVALTGLSGSIIQFGDDAPHTVAKRKLFHMFFDGGLISGTDCVRVDGLKNSEFDDVEFRNCSVNMIVTTGANLANNINDNIFGGGGAAPSLTARGIQLNSQANHWTISGMTLAGGGESGSGVGIEYDGGSGLTLIGNQLSGWNTAHFFAASAAAFAVTVSGGYFENNNIHFRCGTAGTAGLIVSGLSISGTYINSISGTDTFGIALQQVNGFSITGNRFNGTFITNAIQMSADAANTGADNGFVGPNFLNGNAISVPTSSTYSYDQGRQTLGPITFANLSTSTNGTFLFCSDCTIANPCAGAGTGALAKRLNGVWVCN